MLSLKQISTITAFRRLFYGGALLFFAVIIGYGVFYLVSGYDALKQWFFSMNDCFYRNYDWSNSFFTAKVKAEGNYFAIVGILLAAMGVVYIIRHRRDFFAVVPYQHAKTGRAIKWYGVVVLMAVAIWYWSRSLANPGPDEIFSAVNCAEISPFQVLAYYMLPNNHVYFNFINGYLARWTDLDPVLTGRFLSLCAYAGFLCCAFYWFSKLFGSRIWALVAIAPAAVQFTPWAFGFQARGYECQLLCAWVALVSLFNYTETGEKKHLRINTFFCVLGFAMVPTFLYYFAAQCIYVVLLQVLQRKFKPEFWKYQFICIAMVFLLYLPALCFSGRVALTANDYVKTADLTVTSFFPKWLEAYQYFVNYIFGFLVRENHAVNFALFFAPLALLFSRNRQHRRVGIFYFTFWVTWVLMCFYMKRIPFGRNMIIHYSFSIVIITYAVYSLLDGMIRKMGKELWRNTARVALFVVPAVALFVHLFTWGKESVHYFLYFIDVNSVYATYKEDLKNIPVNSTVAFSDERYCFYYVCREESYKPSRCPTGNEEYYVKSTGETLPAMIAENYTLFKVCFSGDIYKHR